MNCIDNSTLTLERITKVQNKLDFYRECVKTGNESDILYESDLAVLYTALETLTQEFLPHNVAKEDWLSFYENTDSVDCSYDMQVIKFIADIRWHDTNAHVDVIVSLFSAGYCWHFANLLKTTFQRGSVVLAYPYSHVVWLDDNEVAYDINGVYTENVTYLDFDLLGDIVYDFKHIDGMSSRMSDTECFDLIGDIVEGKEVEIPILQSQIDIWHRYCRKYKIPAFKHIVERQRLESVYGTADFYQQLEKDLL